MNKKLKQDFAEFESFVFDMDGVVWLDGSLIPGAIELFETLRAANKQILLFTNNASKSRNEYVSRLAKLGIAVEKNEIISSASACALYLAQEYGPSKIHAMGTVGLKEELEDAGHSICENNADFVVVGLDREFNWEKLNKAFQNIHQNKAKFIACNDDAILVVKEGMQPGTGANLAALQASVGHPPEVVIGKPNQPIISFLTQALNGRKAILFGDKLSKDIASAKKANISSAFVLSGVDSREDLERSDSKPTFVMDSIADTISK